MIFKNFKHKSLDKLYVESETAEVVNEPMPTIDNLRFIDYINQYEFVFMDMTDFRLYRTEIDRKIKKSSVDGVTIDTHPCIEVRPKNVMTVKYIPVESKNNDSDIHSPVRLATY